MWSNEDSQTPKRLEIFIGLMELTYRKSWNGSLVEVKCKLRQPLAGLKEVKCTLTRVLCSLCGYKY